MLRRRLFFSDVVVCRYLQRGKYLFWPKNVEKHAKEESADMPDYNHLYQFNVYSRRWGRRDSYRIKLTPTGWNIGHIAINGNSDKTGKNILFANFHQDYINYPYNIGDYMERLWERAHRENLSVEQIQEMLQALADWVSVTEENTPEFVYG